MTKIASSLVALTLAVAGAGFAQTTAPAPVKTDSSAAPVAKKHVKKHNRKNTSATTAATPSAAPAAPAK